MPIRLDSTDADFEARFAALLKSRQDEAAGVSQAVAGIIDQVRNEGDAAVIDLTRRFDNRQVGSMAELAIHADMLEAAYGRTDASLRDALTLAATRIKAFHEAQFPADIAYEDAAGVRLGMRHGAIDAAGLYVPGGKAAYPSSVLMNAIPAVVAGVGRQVMLVPAPGGEVADVVLAAAHIAGIKEAWTIGGAQAIAALAFGTESIAPVDKITGPGNAYVAAAKRCVFGHVGIDAIAGPSEVLILADAGGDPSWLAIDLLSQAEHDEAAMAILITIDTALADATMAEINAILPRLKRQAVAGASWRQHGAVITVRDWHEGAGLANRLAAEHVEIMTEDPHALAAMIRHAGAIFLGRWTPEAIGDYVAGPNHVLPTGRAARFSSGLGVADFMKRTTMVECDAASLGRIAPAALCLAEAEGLEAHGLSLSKRLRGTLGGALGDADGS